MKSNTIIINGDKYLVEMVDSDIVSTKEYIVFRNTDVINDMSIDTDIYLVSKDDYDSNVHIWPSTNTTSIPLLSLNPRAFTETINVSSINEPLEISSIKEINSKYKNVFPNYSFNLDYYRNLPPYEELLDKHLNIKSVKTIKFRIWHPTTDLHRKMILYTDSWVNSLHIHWYCNLMLPNNTHTGKERRLNQDIYNEYFEIEIPDFRDVLYGSSYIRESSSISKNEY